MFPWSMCGTRLLSPWKPCGAVQGGWAPGSTARWSHPVPGTVVIPEGVLARPYQGAALLLPCGRLHIPKR